MAGVNKVILVGRLGKDPEVRNLENGASVANFTLATSETWKDQQGNKKEATEWHNIVLWRGLADIAAKYLHKGDLVYIEGKLRTRKWDKEGITRYTTEVVGDEMTMLSTQRQGQQSNDRGGDQQQERQSHKTARTAQNAPEGQQASGTEQDEDLPF